MAVQQLEITAKDLGEKIKECLDTKLDEKVYDREIGGILDQMNQISRRQGVGEDEAREFADFMLRYTPLITHNTITEHLNSCLDARHLTRLQTFQN